MTGATILRFFRAIRRRTGDPMLPLMVAAQLVMSPPVHAAESIVGTWAPNPAECTPVNGLVEIGAKSVNADDLSCTFDDVSRTGNVVTWRGRCTDGTRWTDSTVVATLRGRTLDLDVGGQGLRAGLRRCR